METIGQQRLWSFFDGSRVARAVRCAEVRRGQGHPVKSFMELVTKIAELQFRNNDHVLLFRGQSGDYRNVKENTTLKPTLFRPEEGAIPTATQLSTRFAALLRAEAALVGHYASRKFLGLDRVKRQRVVRWAILQHYEVCPTPLLDVTHSLRVAASFASLNAKDHAFVFVLGVPNLSGSITASAEAGLQIIRLASACPPSAVRPHVQEGYLLGEYPEMAAYSQKEMYGHYEIDFGRRLIAKFVFNPKTFWKRDTFPQVRKDALYPPESEDPVCALAGDVKRSLAG